MLAQPQKPGLGAKAISRGITKPSSCAGECWPTTLMGWAATATAIAGSGEHFVGAGVGVGVGVVPLLQRYSRESISKALQRTVCSVLTESLGGRSFWTGTISIGEAASTSIQGRFDWPPALDVDSTHGLRIETAVRVGGVAAAAAASLLILGLPRCLFLFLGDLIGDSSKEFVVRMSGASLKSFAAMSWSCSRWFFLLLPGAVFLLVREFLRPSLELEDIRLLFLRSEVASVAVAAASAAVAVAVAVAAVSAVAADAADALFFRMRKKTKKVLILCVL